MNKRDIIDNLENLIMKRFKTLKETKEYLKKLFPGYKIILEHACMDGISDTIDYDLIGNLYNKKDDIFCDFDLYYAKTRAKEMIITEVGYEFE